MLTTVDVTYTYQPFFAAGFNFPSLNIYTTLPPTTIHRRGRDAGRSYENHLPKHRIKKDEGSTLIEFALIGFTFVILLLSVVEMGRMLLVYTTIANAARAGARYAIVHGGERTGSGIDGPSGPTCPCAQVDKVVTSFASAGLVTTSNLTITVEYPDGTNTAGSRVTVKVMYPYDPLIRFFNSMLGTTMGTVSEGVITF